MDAQSCASDTGTASSGCFVLAIGLGRHAVRMRDDILFPRKNRALYVGM